MIDRSESEYRVDNTKGGRILVGHCSDSSIVIGLVGEAKALIQLDLEEAARMSRDLAKLIRSLKRAERRAAQGGA